MLLTGREERKSGGISDAAKNHARPESAENGQGNGGDGKVFDIRGIGSEEMLRGVSGGAG